MTRAFEILSVYALIAVAVLLACWTPQNLTTASVYSKFNDILNADPYSAQVYYKSVAIGYNTNADLVVRAVSVLNKLGLKATPNSKSIESVKSLQDFSDLVSRYMAHGSAVERVIVDADLCSTIVDAARATEGKELIGGNAALIALRMADHTKVILAGSLSDELKKQLHTNVSLLEGQAAPNPTEAHLILEYAKGEKWGEIVAPRANRVIVHCDRTNAELKTMKSFHQLVNLPPRTLKKDQVEVEENQRGKKGSRADLLVLSGLHLLDQEPSSIQKQKLEELLQVVDHATQLDASIPVHLELASVGNLAYISLLGNKVVPNVNSLGLNEQELGFLYFALTHTASDFSSAAEFSSAAAQYVERLFRDPSPELVLEALSELFSLPFAHNERKLDRVHFHSLKFHIIATRTGSNWQNSAAGVIRGSLAASVHACGFDRDLPFDISRVDFLADSHARSLFTKLPLHTTSEGEIDFAIAPVLVCKNPKSTVGLGDAISASGLLHHKFASK